MKRFTPHLIGLGTGVLILGLRTVGWLQSLELAALDQFFRWRPYEVVDPPEIVIVTIDESFLKQSNNWPISDQVLTELIEQIKRQKPTVIGLDLYRNLPVPPGTTQLRSLMAETPNLVGITKITGDWYGGTVPPPEELAGKGQIGFNDVILDDDGKVRRALLSVKEERKPSDSLQLSLAAQLALIHLASKNIYPEAIEQNPSQLRLGKTLLQPIDSTFGSYINSDSGGYQILLNFPNSACRHRFDCGIFPRIPIQNVLSKGIPDNIFTGRVVLIGTTAESIRDKFMTPFSGGNQITLSGVEFHAEVVLQLVLGATQGRPSLQALPEWAEYGWIMIWSALGALLGALVLPHRYWALGATAASGVLLWAGCFVGFIASGWIPVIPPFLALVLASTGTAGFQAYHRLEDHALELEDKVQRRTASLTAEIQERLMAEQTLQETLENLRQTLNQLVESEKTAALGSLMAGIAHEINTPLGNGILASSTLVSETAFFLQEYEATPLTRSVLMEYLEMVRMTSEMILVNLQRAGELVQSFKQVAVDRVSGERRSFLIYPYLQEIMLSLEPQLKQGKHKVHLICDPQLSMDSYPGALSQVITNLVMNSILHGYPTGETGNITLRVTRYDTILEFLFRDNGVGIPSEYIAQIFAPFFTTTRGQGGSGLGLYIVYSLVTQTLQGNIKVESIPGDGTCVTIKLPLSVG